MRPMTAVRDVSVKIVCADRPVNTRRGTDPGETLCRAPSAMTPFSGFRRDFCCSVEDCA